MAHRISSPEFVGRAAELRAFDRLLEQAAAGTGGALMVAGEAGIGKSRLVSELKTRARALGALVLVGECVELAEGELAFAPLVSALRPVIEARYVVERLDPPVRSALAALWPSLGNGGGTSREQLLEAVYRVLAGRAERQLVLLLLEDVHWIDRSSRDLLGFLVRNARRDRLIMVVTYRPDELDRSPALRPFLAERQQSGRAERLDLEPLTRTELAEQLAATVGSKPSARRRHRWNRRPHRRARRRSRRDLGDPRVSDRDGSRGGFRARIPAWCARAQGRAGHVATPCRPPRSRRS